MKPARRYTIERVTVPVQMTKCSRVNGRFMYEEYEETGGFLVHFPQGHSTYFSNEDKLREAGIDANDDAFVDMETGEIVPFHFVPRDMRK